MRRVIAGIGYVLIALVVAGICLQVFDALRHNRPFYGVNYMWIAIPTYSTAVVIFIGAAIGLVRLVQIARARHRARRRG